MKYRLLLIGACCAGSPAAAAEFAVKPQVDLRLRFEQVDQDGFERDAEALTARARAGFEISKGALSLLAEGEATVPVRERYDSGLNGRTVFPIIADPENIELNRLQLQFRAIPKTIATLGRQRINLDDQRFVGSVGWRDNEQTFDAVRIEWSGIKRVKADLTYAWSDRTIWGSDGVGARQRAIGGDNLFANLSYATPYGALAGFIYLVDQDEAAVAGYRLSSQTFGVRFAGSHALSRSAKLNYAASYARQSDYHRNPNDYSADYYSLEAGLDLAPVKLGGGYEVLGADDGRPLTSVQTPLATLHKFQGWADKFLTTPANGVRDVYASAGLGWSKIGGFDSVGATLVYHQFDSDRQKIDYGSEWNAALSLKRGRWTVLAKYADYRAQSFATDTRKAWLQLEWAY